jgi:serine/threonine protein kinase
MTEPENSGSASAGANQGAEKAKGDSVVGPGGVVLDQYILLEKLSASRTGLVFKAKHRLMGRTVAVKFLSPEAAASAAYTARFHRAIQILSRMQHPNLVQVYELGQQGEVEFVVMEYVDGKDLRTIIKENGPMPVDYAVRYLIQAATGLARAHEQGVTHRDVKPGNLLVDQQGIVKIVGFTLAHVESGGAAAEAGVDDNLTRQGQVMGTYEYMSPEQAMDSSSVDRRADIYSLGCTLHMLLTGRPPYVSKPGMQQILAHRTQPIPSLRRTRPEVPEALDRVFQKMIAKAPDDRYASMAEAAADLEASLAAPAPASQTPAENLRAIIARTPAADQTPVAGPAAAEPAVRPVRRGPRLAPIVVGGVLTVVAIVFAVQYFQEKKPPEVAKSAALHEGKEQPGAAPTAEPTPAPKPATSPSKAVSPETAASKPPATGAKAVEKPAAPPKDDRPESKPEPKPEAKPEPKPGSEPETKPVEPGTAAPKSPTSPVAVPDEAARQRALKLLQDTFQEELANAGTNEQKAALAQKMLRQSKTMEDDPAGRFVLLETSCALAKKANDPTTALQTVDLMAQSFAVDAWPKKTELLAEMAQGAKMLAHHRALAEQALILSQKAAKARQFGITARLSELAVAEAGKAHDPKLFSRAHAAAKDSKNALAQFREYEAAKARLQQEPGNAKATLAAGRYECLVLDDWDQGLRKLAAGSDESLRAVAAKDLAAPKDADAQAAVGDGWWELAKDEAGADQAALLHRAASWYEKASSEATGLLKSKLEKRLRSMKGPAAKATSTATGPTGDAG